MAGKGGGAWKVAYADFVTAMMAFFMVMWLISQNEDVKNAVADHFRNPYGQFAVGDSLMPPHHPQFFKDRRPRLSHGKSPTPPDPKSPSAQRPFTMELDRGDRTSVGTVVYFAEDQTTLDDAAGQRLRDFAELVRGKPQKIEIRGHASRRSHSAQASSLSWQISYERCQHVLDFLIQQGIPSRQVRLSQSGAFEPLTLGDQPERVAGNARVEVFVLNEIAADAMGTREERERRYQTPELGVHAGQPVTRE